jgi:hypothetical protein
MREKKKGSVQRKEEDHEDENKKKKLNTACLAKEMGFSLSLANVF